MPARFWARPGSSKVTLELSIWSIMFFFQFVFPEVIDMVFGDSVQISSFVGLVLIIVSMVVVSQVVERIDGRLADGSEDRTAQDLPG